MTSNGPGAATLFSIAQAANGQLQIMCNLPPRQVLQILSGVCEDMRVAIALEAINADRRVVPVSGPLPPPPNGRPA